MFPKTTKCTHKNVTVNHFVHHVPCYTNTIQRIHYGADCSPLWLILKMITVPLLRGIAQPLNAEVSSSEVFDWAPSTAHL